MSKGLIPRLHVADALVREGLRRKHEGAATLGPCARKIIVHIRYIDTPPILLAFTHNARSPYAVLSWDSKDPPGVGLVRSLGMA